jgi:hypothetical protein
MIRVHGAVGAVKRLLGSPELSKADLRYPRLADHRQQSSRREPRERAPQLSLRLAEAEATLAARVVGLDPGLGLLHADQLSDSLAADLMEPVRPLVDRFVLEILTTRSLSAADFYETRQVVCRITPPRARELAQTLPRWRLAVGRIAEVVAQRLLDDGGHRIPFPRQTRLP